MKISVIGAGYVGAVTAVCLAEKGNQVCCYDIDKEKIDLLNKGIPTILMETSITNDYSQKLKIIEKTTTLEFKNSRR